MRKQGVKGWLKDDITNRGVTAWALSGMLLAFYVILYWGGSHVGPIPIPDLMGGMASSLSRLFGLVPAGQSAAEYCPQHYCLNKWTIYGFIYTVAIVVGGIYVASKYRHNAYQLVRTSVVVFVQISLAFSIPEILKFFQEPGFLFSYLWPLEIKNLYPSTLSDAPLYFAVWSVVASLIITPILAVLYGKRWYCSWVCGCGGLANTAGEPFRHLTPTSSSSWKFEKVAVHSVLILAFLVTGLLVASSFVGDQYQQFHAFATGLKNFYGFAVVMILSGIAGVVVYPIGGTRFWCRYFCPMAALLGLLQKFGRFRITVKDKMCISCGLCSKYCEMGIDVRAYAQADEDFTRAACVGCGLCEEVCPRGVLHLENKWDQDPQELTVSSLLSESYKDP